MQVGCVRGKKHRPYSQRIRHVYFDLSGGSLKRGHKSLLVLPNFKCSKGWGSLLDSVCWKHFKSKVLVIAACSKKYHLGQAISRLKNIGKEFRKWDTWRNRALKGSCVYQEIKAYICPWTHDLKGLRGSWPFTTSWSSDSRQAGSRRWNTIVNGLAKHRRTTPQKSQSTKSGRILLFSLFFSLLFLEGGLQAFKGKLC